MFNNNQSITLFQTDCFVRGKGGHCYLRNKRIQLIMYCCFFKLHSLMHNSSPPVFSGVRVTQSLVLCVCFIDPCLSFCTFSCGHCVVCSSIYEFWLPIWYLQILPSTCTLESLVCNILLRHGFSDKNFIWTHDLKENQSRRRLRKYCITLDQWLQYL